MRGQLDRFVPALTEAAARNTAELRQLAAEANAHLGGMKVEAEDAKRRLDAAARRAAAPGPGG